MTGDQTCSGQRLIIASNRLPLSIQKHEGNYEATPSSGGLVAALRGLNTANYLWLGWPGMEIDNADRKSVDAALAKENVAAVYIDDQLAQNHYNGFSTQTLSNWILPPYAFPSRRLLERSPVQKDLLHGVLGSDIIGFHTDEYMKNFIGACEVLLHASVVDHCIHYENRTVRLGRYVVGIDYQRFSDAINDQAVRSRIQELGDIYKNKKVIIGVDRLDYTKGLPEKLQGFQVFLDEHPEWSEKVVLIQIAIPSREDVKEYQTLEEEVSRLAGQIAGKHSTPHSTPLLYIHRSVSFAELTALYSISDVCLLSSRRDGMNLVASEYVACQEERHGVLVLSEFTGAASFLEQGSLLFNPSSASGLSEALHQALTMESQQRKTNYEQLRGFVTTHTSAKWTETFLDELCRLKE